MYACNLVIDVKLIVKDGVWKERKGVFKKSFIYVSWKMCVCDMIHVHTENSQKFSISTCENFQYFVAVAFHKNLDWLGMINWKIIFATPGRGF